jgi:4-amino-4-deoxy-L-arabinose transferase-like glycosyltransferase
VTQLESRGDKRPPEAASRWFGWWIVLVPLVIFVVTGLRGLDFGFHWDEDYHVGTLREALEEGTVLPGSFRYPSVSHWLCVAGLAPELLRGAPPELTLQEHLSLALESQDYLLRVRAIFLCVSALSLLPVFALVWGWRRRPLEALLAACLIGGSWEVAYHARWLAPDGVLMTFAALTLFGATRACLAPGRHRSLVLAALAAGAACGTKWPAGLLLLPVLLAAWFGLEGAERRRLLIALLGLVGWFSLAYLVTTPGTILDASTVIDALAMQQGKYASGHLGHTVGRGPEHLLKLLEYFSLSFFSRFPLVSLLFFGASLVGCVSLVRESRRLAWVTLSFPLSYLLFFSAYPVMIPRNYLILAPFLALLAARGTAVLVLALPRPAMRGAAVAGVLTLLLLDAAWLVHAGESIRVGDRSVFVRQLAAHVDAHPDTHYAASPTILRHLRQLDGRRRPHVARPLEEADEVIFYASEAYGHIAGLRTRHDLARATFGPLDVNFNYYPSWLGEDRIVVLPASRYPRKPIVPPEHLPPQLRPGFAK